MPKAISIPVLSIILVVACGTTALFQLPLKDRSAFAGHPGDESSVTILTLGDYGEGDFRQRRVAAMLEAECRASRGNVLVQTVGDNFYPHGVQDARDPLWQSMFESMYDTPCLMRTKFYAALGNHDYMGVPAAQVNYARANGGSGRWQMPAMFYSHEHGQVDGAPLVQVVVLDTMQSLTEQIALIDSAFGTSAEATWRVVVGHYNVRTYSLKYHEDKDLRQALLPTLRANKVHFYLSGHSHNLQLISMPGEPVYVVAGGGGASPRELIDGDPEIAVLTMQRLGFPVITFKPGQAQVKFVTTSGEFLTTFSTQARSFSIDKPCLESQAATGCISRQ